MEVKGIHSCTEPCPPSKPFCSDRLCYSTCPVFTLIFNSTYCIDSDACKKLGWKKYENRCVEKCPHLTYELNDEFGLDGLMVCDTMVASVVTTVVSVIIIFFCCALFRYQLTTKHPAEEETDPTNESVTDTRPLLDTDQTEVMDVWTDQGGYSARTHVSTTGVPSTDVHRNNTENDDDSLLHVRTGPDLGCRRSGDSHPVFKDDDEFSSVPTVVRLRGYQEDSMDISECSTRPGTSRESGVFKP